MAHKTVRQREAAIDDRLNNLGVCSLDMGGDAPAPDPMIGQAAADNVQLSREALQYYREKDAEMKPYRDKAMELASEQARVQIETAKKQNAMADDTRAYELSTFRPIEQKIAADALGYDTPERRNAAAAEAQADVGTAADAARGNMIREVTSRGGDVNSGNFTAGLAGMTGREIALQAASGNQARKNVEAIGGAKLADAANMGRGIASTNTTQTQLGLAAGNSGVANARVPGAITDAQVAGNNGAVGTAMQGNSEAARILQGQYNGQAGAQGDDSAIWSTLGSVAGGMMMMSDKNEKEDAKPASGEIALSAVRKTPVKTWRYKKDSVANDGGKKHVGPMAQDVQKNMGNEVAPGGKQIDLISLVGTTLAAVKEVDKKVERRLIALENGKQPGKSVRERSRK